MSKKFDDYYLGLDIGTDSVGWAVTDREYNLQKLNGKALWGVRLFSPASTAEDRRIFRSARRRQARKVQRIKELQSLFAEEIYKVDPGFYLRLKESKYYKEDKTIEQSNTLFNDKNYKDIDFHNEYPTIYHLRKRLIKDKSKADIRLVYLAIHNILKHRGHFLFEGQNINSVIDFENVFKEFQDTIRDELGIEIECTSVLEIERTLKNKELGKKEKEKMLIKLFNISKEDKQLKAIIGLMVGGTKKISELFNEANYDEMEINKISFDDKAYEEIRVKLSDQLLEKMYVVDKIKAIYDWTILDKILKGTQYISEAKCMIYDKHEKDLKLLKNMIKKYKENEYKHFFCEVNAKSANYPSYIKMNIKNNKKQYVKEGCSQEDICKNLEKIIGDVVPENGEEQYVLNEIHNRTLLPKQISKDNGVIPYQVNEEELKVILENSSKYYEFLNVIDEWGISVKDKIIKIFEFRIPYYVGPLNNAHYNNNEGNCWIEKKSDEKIYPWNFEQVVDIEKTAERFIRRMTNKCTYLIKEDVLPMNSLIYSEFMVLNEINNIRINGDKISVELKNKIYRELFLTKRKVTGKKLKDFLLSEGVIESNDEISGFDQNFKSSLTAYHDFKNIIKNKELEKEDIEKIILWITLFGDDKKILKRKINNEYGNKINAEIINKICKLKYTGWGRLSKKFLLELEGANKETGECGSIIYFMKNTNKNLMQLLSYDFNFLDKIQEENKNEKVVNKIDYSLVKDLYVSPSVKHMIWQTLIIVKEIKKIMKKQPKKIFIEMARGKDEIKTRKNSRRQNLIDLYKACKNEERDWVKELESKEDEDFRRDKLYLYYTQKGRCMYSGERIELSDLYNNNLYDIDHIFPQSKTKDDSIDNRVLVKKNLNSKKTDNYPIEEEIRNKQKDFWRMLHEQKLISDKKYDRLTRCTELTDAELAEFIARQIVETRQTTKAVADILKQIFDKSNIVYVKAGNVSAFRHENDMLKVRSINDLHHAKDAYLNIVVGNVYNVKFTNSPINYVKEAGFREYNLDKMYRYDVTRGNDCAWKAGANGTINTIKKVMTKNNILYTRASYEAKGGLFNQTLIDKETCKKGKGYIPLKMGKDNRPMLDITKYGGYGSVAGAYFFLVEHTVKKKRIRTIEFLPLYFLKQNNINENEMLERYCNEVLHLENPIIKLKKIKFQSLIKVNGYYLFVTGRTNKQLLVSNAVQLCLNKEFCNYIKRVEKYINDLTEKPDLEIDEHYKITKEDNEKLYLELMDKHTSTIYSKRINSPGELLIKGKEKFNKAKIEDQCKVIMQILQLTQYKNIGADLTLIGGAKQSGKMLISKEITKYNEFLLINQSPTGIFKEKEIDLLNI